MGKLAYDDQYFDLSRSFKVSNENYSESASGYVHSCDLYGPLEIRLMFIQDGSSIQLQIFESHWTLNASTDVFVDSNA